MSDEQATEEGRYSILPNGLIVAWNLYGPSISEGI